jgi:hypothetical protein
MTDHLMSAVEQFTRFRLAFGGGLKSSDKDVHRKYLNS